MCDSAHGRWANQSSGYEGIAEEFLAWRGKDRSIGIGVPAVREWAKRLPVGATVLDVGCGPGFPITSALVDAGFQVYGVDGSPSLVEAFRRNLPEVPILCEAVQGSRFFDRTFDGVVAWGLVFLLSVEDQRRLIRRFAEVLRGKGRLLFTASTQSAVWTDAMTGLPSVSLGAEEYRRLLSAEHLWVEREYEDEGENHYFEAVKDPQGQMAVSRRIFTVFSTGEIPQNCGRFSPRCLDFKKRVDGEL